MSREIVLTILAAYLVGSIPTALIVGRVLGGYDIRSKGSGNAGATNIYRLFGLRPYIFVLAVDLFKGWFATSIPSLFFNARAIELAALAALAAIVGHIWTIFAKGKGGKGVATGAGAFFALAPIETAIALTIYFIGALGTKYVSVGSIAGASALPIALLIGIYFFGREVPPITLLIAFLAQAIVIYAHRANIARLIRGTENKTEFSLRGDKRS